jgi:plastocyanin
MRFAIPLVVALAFAFPALAASRQVTITNFDFSPAVITVAPGTTVVWTNNDDDPHTINARDKTFHSGALDTDGKFTFTFVKPGVYAYFCSLHPHMTGQVVVK